MSKKKGENQHYLPAGYIGRFSLDDSGRAREREVWALRRDQSTPFPVKAQNIAKTYDVYTLQDVDENPKYIDSFWKRTEDRIHQLDDLERSTEGTLDAAIWAEFVLPFLAQMFVRHPTYSDYFLKRFTGNNAGALEVFNNADLANRGRLFDEIHFRAVLSKTYMEICHPPSDDHFVTNDTGMFVVYDNRLNIFGYGFPLSRSSLLMLHRTERTPTIIKRKGKWLVTGILHRYLDTSEVTKLNMEIAEWAIDTVIGPTPDVVKTACFMRNREVVPLEKRMKYLFNKGEKQISYEDIDIFYDLLRRIGSYDNLPVVLYHERDKTEPSIVQIAFDQPNAEVKFEPLPEEWFPDRKK